jgi:hypothetical protein
MGRPRGSGSGIVVDKDTHLEYITHSGVTFKIDYVDEELLRAHSWHAMTKTDRPGSYLVCCGSRLPCGRQLRIIFHRKIMDVGVDEFVDHRNGDFTDNRRSNLRKASRCQNRHNSRMPSHSRSGYKGVTQRAYGLWRARIGEPGQGGRRLQLGDFKTAEEAARAYDRAAIELYGEFASINFPQNGERAARV